MRTRLITTDCERTLGVLQAAIQRQKRRHAALHACGSERTKRNQCDFQQLYRELEQRKRCDRLSVGRIHKQLFHHLRTRLSEFERRKHHQLQRDRVKCEDDLLLPSASLQWVRYKPQFQRQKCADDGLRACGSERTKRNQCDCEQLYGELEKRKRCDRLSVGRIYKQLFHHVTHPVIRI